MRCLNYLVMRDIKKMKDCMGQMLVWDMWYSKQMSVNCNNRHVRTERACVCEFYCKDAAMKPPLAQLPRSWVSHNDRP